MLVPFYHRLVHRKGRCKSNFQSFFWKILAGMFRISCAQPLSTRETIIRRITTPEFHRGFRRRSRVNFFVGSLSIWNCDDSGLSTRSKLDLRTQVCELTTSKRNIVNHPAKWGEGVTKTKNSKKFTLARMEALGVRLFRCWCFSETLIYRIVIACRYIKVYSIQPE